MAAKKQSRKGEMRRRWRALLEDGSLAALRSEGRLAALYVLYAADWSTCEIRFSMRRVARLLQVHPTAVRRGVSQLVEAGILGVLEKGIGGNSSRFLVQARTRVVSTPDPSGVHPCAPLVRRADTSRAQPGHEPCAARARAVRGARTLCARNSVLSSGSPVRTSGDTSEATPGAGEVPAPACLPIFDSSAGESAAG